MQWKKVGIVGTGSIGSVVSRILHAFDCELIGYDNIKDVSLQEKYQLRYTGLEEFQRDSDIISIHLPLNKQTRYLIDRDFIEGLKPGVMLINTARGGIVHTPSVIEALKTGKIGAFGMDVYEHESRIFFYDHSKNPPADKHLSELLKMPNVLITPHQAFATREAITNIATTTFYNALRFANEISSENELTASKYGDVKEAPQQSYMIA
jgi:D-lactate dehydrogenase